MTVSPGPVRMGRRTRGKDPVTAMPVPVGQMWAVTRHVLKHRLVRRNRRYPLVLMLEPLFRCNLECAGCGKVQYPRHIRMRQLSVEQCLEAAIDCGAPVVSIAGGEPLLHPDIDTIAAELVKQRRYVYLCTNAILLPEHLHRFEPGKHLSFSIHLDGPADHHDFAVCREGVYEQAVEAIRLAVGRGFRVTTNTTLFDTADVAAMRGFFDMVMDLGVESMTISPGYAYDKAANQSAFLKRERTTRLFRRLLANHGASDRGGSRWRFNQSPLYLEFLAGRHPFECHPWGNPTYNVFGWQVPCYLLQEGYVDTFAELMELTDWSRYGQASGNPKCRDCMVHSGYEPAAVDYSLGSIRGLWKTVAAMARNRRWQEPPMGNRCPDDDHGSPDALVLPVAANGRAVELTVEGMQAAGVDRP